MGMEKLLSIIVPAYNGEKYLEKCITSIIDQSYKNLEIILIDDKSPDLSGEICEKFAMKDDRIKVFHNKENMGICGTRNKGISIASGDYVTFVDDDDYIEKTMYQKMMQKFEENQEVDLVLCNFENIRETGAKIGKSREKEGKYFKDEIRKDFLYRLIGNQEIACAVWRCIFKKEKIIENDIKFIASRVKDDMCFLINGMDVRKYGSQGQQRTAALSLKLAEIELVKQIIHDTPVLFLDDVLSELDSRRQNFLLDSIGNIQTMITCTGLDEFINNRFSINKIFKVVNGTVSSMEHR